MGGNKGANEADDLRNQSQERIQKNSQGKVGVYRNYRRILVSRTFSLPFRQK